MSIESADIIDGIGLRSDGAVEMLISDHLEWDHEAHLQLLSSKIEAYANAVISGQLAQVYPAALDRPVCIKLVWRHAPNTGAARFFESLAEQLRGLGIEFNQAGLPDGY